MIEAKTKALEIAQKLIGEQVSNEEKFNIAATLVAAGLGVAKHMLVSGKTPPMRGVSLVEDLEALCRELREALRAH